MSERLQRSCLDDARGANEERTKPYVNTVMGVPQFAARRIAKRLSSVASSAREQAQLSGVLK